MYPVLEIVKSFELEHLSYPLTIRRLDRANGPQEVDESGVALRRRRTGPPEVRLAQLLGNHLKVMKLVAGRNTLTTKKDQHGMVGLRLLPPQLLVAIHVNYDLCIPQHRAKTSRVATAMKLCKSSPIGQV
jgi:hypothetical protein